MKYMLLIYNEENAKRSEKVREDCTKEAVKLAEQLRSQGQYRESASSDRDGKKCSS